jgi:phage terminase large subunit GpA-like protein
VLLKRAAKLTKPTPRTTPDEWAIANRSYPPSAGVPGPRDPYLTPYMVAFGRAAAEGTWKRVVMAMFAQGGKSDTLLDLIGQRFDQRPAPVLYVGPTRQFLTEQWEPRIAELLDQAPTLKEKVGRGKKSTKTKKIIAGVPLRLAHAGSSAALKSDPFALALTDEADELMRNVKGQGDPISLIDRRGDTYADFTHAIVSTPSEGPKDVVRDEASGLEFWADQEPADLNSKIWGLWQEGTRYHWAWKCPHCTEWFIPRFACLEIPGGHKTTPAKARAEARLVCPRNGCVIEDQHKADMNAAGQYVAPGQRFEGDEIVGDPPVSSTISFWVSGLASPFVTFGERAEAYITALRSGDNQTVKAVINGGFGELWAPQGGDVPEWEEVRKLALPYREGEVPSEAIFITAGVDVQKNRLPFVVRAWGARQTSWLITSGELWGETAEPEVWLELAELLRSTFDGMPIRMAFVDAGFRPGKRDMVPEHRVYSFVRQFPRNVYATKGFDKRPTPLSINRIDVTPKGAKAKVGLDLVRLDTDFFKSFIHERLRWPADQPGGWYLHDQPTEEYCRQVVSEARVKKPSGGVQWVTRYRENHFFDCEALAYAAAYQVGVQRIRDGSRRATGSSPPPPPARSPDTGSAPSERPQAPRAAKPSWLGNTTPRGGSWL